MSSRNKGDEEPEPDREPEDSESAEIAGINEVLTGEARHESRVCFVLEIVEQQIGLAHDRSLHKQITLEQQQSAGELIAKLARLFNFYMFD